MKIIPEIMAESISFFGIGQLADIITDTVYRRV